MFNFLSRWTKEDSNNLYWFHQQCNSCEDPIEAIINMYENSGVHDKTRISVSCSFQFIQCALTNVC